MGDFPRRLPTARAGVRLVRIRCLSCGEDDPGLLEIASSPSGQVVHVVCNVCSRVSLLTEHEERPPEPDAVRPEAGVPTSRETLAHAAQQLDDAAALLRAIARELGDETCRQAGARTGVIHEPRGRS